MAFLFDCVSISIACLFDCAEKFPRGHHLNPKLAGTGEVSDVEGDEMTRLRRDCRLQNVRVLRILGVSPLQVVDLMALGLPEKQADKRERFSPRPAGGLPVAEQDLLVFEHERNGHVHPDLFLAHQVKDPSGGALPAAEGGHEDIGIEDGVCSSDGGPVLHMRFLCEPYKVSGAGRFHPSMVVADDLVKSRAQRQWDRLPLILRHFFLRRTSISGRHYPRRYPRAGAMTGE